MARTALLIIGMHRAGTSALARVCSLRGAQLPRRVLPPNEGNAGGYWEPEAVVALNTRILAFFDLTWDDPFAGVRLPPVEAIPAEFHDQARELLADEYGDAPLFVVKDPRCTLLQRFWIDVMRSMGIVVCPIVIMRPWAEVVASLVRRDGTSAESAALLYVGYGLAAARLSDPQASFVTYAQLVADWRGCTDRIAAEQHFEWGAGTHEDDIANYLRPPQASSAQASLSAPLASWADTVWRWFQAAASDQSHPHADLDAVSAALGQSAVLFAPLFADRARLQRQTEREREEALGERNAALGVYEATDARLSATQRDYAWLEAEHARQRGEFEQHRHEFEQQLQSMEADRDRLLALYQDTDAGLRQAQSDYVERDQEAGQLRRALDEVQHRATQLREELALVLGSRSWKLTRPLRFVTGRLHRLRAPAGAVLPVSAPGDVDAFAEVPGPSQRGRRHARQHAMLRRFLVAEFDEHVASDVIATIERYALPVPAADTRAALRTECTPEEALEWAAGLAPKARARLPAGHPDVSIVVPVYNQAPFTLACIDALLGHQTRHSFEILVGDDGSTDATATAVAAIPGVRHVRHAENLGFVRNCNATAAQASGRYVVFLNNDTLVLPGWLDALIGTLENDPGIGLAGSKLLYPDGRLQECGAIVWRDGSAWNYGRLADPRRPEFCYLRDVDYVSGASIALAADLWRQLGGFDEIFVPAYAEDADLAFRVRDRGLRTVVQPLSQLLHFEGISSGTDTGAGAKAYQVENLRRLHARWSDELATHRDNAVQPELEKERAIQRRALFIDHCTPTPDEDAGSLVAFEVMQAFTANGYKVTFIPEDNFAHVGRHTRDLQRLGIEAIYHPAYSGMPAFLAARKDPFDVIFLHRFGVAAAHLDALRRAYPRARIIFLNADLHYLREMRQAELAADAAGAASARLTRDRELGVIARVDVALVHSDHEQALLQRELPEAKIVLFPLIHEPAQEAAPLASREGVCFVGGFRHPPNADGIRWFVEAVWPRVIQALPQARLYIVGSHMTPDVRALAAAPGVTIVGYVEDLDGFLDRRRVSVAPLRVGAGAKGKVAGSLARGLPTVCTPIAAEGMGLAPGIDVLVGADADEFAGHVVTLLGDDAQWQRLSEAGLAYARETTSRAAAHRRIRDVLGLEHAHGRGDAPLRESTQRSSASTACRLPISKVMPGRTHSGASHAPEGSTVLRTTWRRPSGPMTNSCRSAGAAATFHSRWPRAGDPWCPGTHHKPLPSRTSLRIAGEGPVGMMLASYSSMTSIPPAMRTWPCSSQIALLAMRFRSEVLCEASTMMVDACRKSVMRPMIFSWNPASPAPIHSSITRMSLLKAVVAANARRMAMPCE